MGRKRMKRGASNGGGRKEAVVAFVDSARVGFS